MKNIFPGSRERKNVGKNETLVWLVSKQIRKNLLEKMAWGLFQVVNSNFMLQEQKHFALQLRYVCIVNKDNSLNFIRKLSLSSLTLTK